MELILGEMQEFSPFLFSSSPEGHSGQWEGCFPVWFLSWVSAGYTFHIITGRSPQWAWFKADGWQQEPVLAGPEGVRHLYLAG